jgi:hypothetical protein
MNGADQEESILTRTGVLEAEFGRGWRFWHWLAKQFSATSMGIIGVILTFASGYIIHLNGKVMAQETEVMILETKVLPIVKSIEKLDLLRTEVASLNSTSNSQEGRLARIEKNIDIDYLDSQRKVIEERVQRRAQRKHK